MSKFIERLKQVLQPAPQPMGFHTNNVSQQRPRIQLIALVDGNVTADKLSPADAVIFNDSKMGETSAIKGAWLKNAEKAESAIKAGADFIVVPADSAIIPADKKVGKVLEISAGVTDVLLRTVNDLPVDAVTLAEDGSKLTWQKLMLFQRFAAIIDKPVIVTVTAEATPEELQLVWETGISGIEIKVKSDSEADSLSSVRSKIDGLTFPVRKKKDRIQATLPKMGAVVEEPDEEDDDEDE